MPYLIETNTQSFYSGRYDFEPEWNPRDYAVLRLGDDSVTDEMIRNAPKILRIKRKKSNISTLARCFLVPGHACVDAEFKELMQSLEPNLHTFIPIEVLDQNNKSYGTRFIHFVHHFADVYDYERTEFEEGFGLEAAQESHFRFRIQEDESYLIVMDPKKAEHRHFWRDSSENGHRTRKNFYCSDRVANFIREKKPVLWSLQKINYSNSH